MSTPIKYIKIKGVGKDYNRIRSRHFFSHLRVKNVLSIYPSGNVNYQNIEEIAGGGGQKKSYFRRRFGSHHPD